MIIPEVNGRKRHREIVEILKRRRVEIMTFKQFLSEERDPLNRAQYKVRYNKIYKSYEIVGGSLIARSGIPDKKTADDICDKMNKGDTNPFAGSYQIRESTFELVILSDDMKSAGKTLRELGIAPIKSGYREGSAKYSFLFKTSFNQDQIQKGLEGNGVKLLTSQLEIKKK